MRKGYHSGCQKTLSEAVSVDIGINGSVLRPTLSAERVVAPTGDRNRRIGGFGGFGGTAAATDSGTGDGLYNPFSVYGGYGPAGLRHTTSGLYGGQQANVNWLTETRCNNPLRSTGTSLGGGFTDYAGNEIH
ncbi:hypothetical protein BV898_19165 [Hypsibius exemplaris]|uniref:Uncharacterized protein n=1 Tax=Hypsibius exemplaris TaxID=2072580 RepID=A0A9X6RNN9_HYPEX|nr:hypothetical protein BV898_19165 [Hypsibius exemplaris]